MAKASAVEVMKLIWTRVTLLNKIRANEQLDYCLDVLHLYYSTTTTDPPVLLMNFIHPNTIPQCLHVNELLSGNSD